MYCENCTKVGSPTVFYTCRVDKRFCHAQGFTLDGTPRGQMLPDGTYFAAASSGSPSSTAIIFLTDIFGLALPNPKIMADELSGALGVDVYVPDLFDGVFSALLSHVCVLRY